MVFGPMLQKREVRVFYILFQDQPNIAADHKNYAHTVEKVLTDRNIMTHDTGRSMMKIDKNDVPIFVCF